MQGLKKKEHFLKCQKCSQDKAGVINDPLGQTHILAKSENCFHLNLFCFEKWGRTYERTTCAKIMITTGRDFGSASWIKKEFKHSKPETQDLRTNFEIFKNSAKSHSKEFFCLPRLPLDSKVESEK